MKPKPIPHSPNIRNCSPQNLPQNNAPIIPGWPGYEMHNIRPNLCGPEPRAPQYFAASNNGSRKDFFQGQNPNITKRQMDFYYAGHVGEVCTPSSSFFGHKRRKPANLDTGFGENSLEKRIGGPPDGMLDNITKGPAAYDNDSSQQTKSKKRQANEDSIRQVQLPGSVGVVRISGEPPTPNGTTGPPTHSNGPSQQTRKRKQPSSEVRSAYVQRPNSGDGSHTVTEPTSSHVSEGPGVNSDNETNVAAHICDQAQSQKRKRRMDEVSTRCTQRPDSDDDVHAISEPSTSHVTQRIGLDGDSQTNVTDGPAHQAQPRKRNRRRIQVSTRRVRRRGLMPNLHPDSDNGFSNIGEGSTSYATQDASPAYDDLGDCTERCNHCNAAFWREERLRGHGFPNGVPQYHLCCGGGKILMQPDPDPPEYIKHLLGDARFMENIRAYNQMFAMTSFGATIDNTVNQGRGPYVFKVSGQIYHRIGSLCPTGDDDPKFLQLYIYDTKNEVQNRLSHFSNSDSATLDPEVVQGLIHFLDAHNELVQVFRTARDKCAEADVPEFKVRLYSGEGPRGYELPTSQALGAIVFDRGPESESNYDVILEYRDGPLKRISKIHKSYMSLQFPLIFIYGQPGFHTKLKLRAANPNDEPKRVSMNAFYTYQLHPRHDNYNLLFRTGRLFQQYVVGVYCCIEQNRIDFYRTHQNDIRGEYLSGLYDAISRGDRDGSEAGSRIILPSSFTGGPRYMYSHYLDALAICRVLGNPKFFITFTCNVKWPEIQRYMAQFPHLATADRADIVCRVFEQKIKSFVRFIKQKRTFGHVTGVLYTIEFQKRGLPHCHTLLWVSSSNKIENPQDVDQYISAELPDPRVDPRGYKIVSEMMMHGPCGKANLNSPCMEGETCTKNFPKKFNNETFFDDKGYPHYRRRQTGVSTTKGQMKLDNSYVVPYNRDLCLAFEAHINVEYCGWSMLIKYLFKYISKGTDRIFAKVTRSLGEASTSGMQPQPCIDEIQNFLDGRFICPHEACWRILKFEIHSREPAVQILSVHLENMQHVTFRDGDNLESVVNRRDRKLTTLTEWFTYNIENEDVQKHLRVAAY